MHCSREALFCSKPILGLGLFEPLQQLSKKHLYNLEENFPWVLAEFLYSRKHTGRTNSSPLYWRRWQSWAIVPRKPGSAFSCDPLWFLLSWFWFLEHTTDKVGMHKYFQPLRVLIWKWIMCTWKGCSNTHSFWGRCELQFWTLGLLLILREPKI